MKKALRLMVALLFLVGIANAQQQTYDFEDGTIPAGWNNDATYPWTVINILSTTGGSHCIQSGNAGVANSTSSISFQMAYTQPGYIMFDANCMGEAASAYDACSFYIDGAVQFSYGDAIMGWHTYGYNVTAGTHTFTWEYSKDNSVDPEGDAFQVDNVVFGFGTACIAPTEIKMDVLGLVSWNGMADSYTLRYKRGSGAWQSITGITENSYDVTSLNLKGNYTFEVKADCDPSHPATATLHFVESWENWYAFVADAPGDDNRFYHFNMDDLTTVTSVSEENDVYKAVFINGYVWAVIDNSFSGNYDLCKAPVNIWNKTIGSFETVIANICTGATTINAMAYNPANGRLYFIMDYDLKSLNLANPTGFNNCGELDGWAYSLAINNQGQAYVNKGYELYTLNLSNAETTLVGSMNLYLYPMSFDLKTGELFGVYSDEKIFYVDPTDAKTTYVGDFGGDSDYYYITNLFMTYDWDAVNETEMESVNVYPNPAQGQFTVEGNGLMVITNILGQEVLRQEVEEKATIELPTGMYIVRLNNAISKVVVE